MKEERREMFARSHDVPRSRRATGRARTFVTLSPATTFFTSAVSINGPALTRFVLSSMVARAGGGRAPRCRCGSVDDALSACQRKRARVFWFQVFTHFTLRPVASKRESRSN